MFVEGVAGQFAFLIPPPDSAGSGQIIIEWCGVQTEFGCLRWVAITSICVPIRPVAAFHVEDAVRCSWNRLFGWPDWMGRSIRHYRQSR
jgi:hypothetical protein